MNFIPLDKLFERIEIARQDSDTTLFLALMYTGEMLTKLVTAGLVGAVLDDRDRHRYRQIHRLVRADGLREWSQVLDEVLTGPASQFLSLAAKEEQRELTQRVGSGAWQFEAVNLLYQSLNSIDCGPDDFSIKVDGRKWFTYFVILRNNTRAHGATLSKMYKKLCPDIEKSIHII